MNDNNIESFVNFTENTNTIFSNIIQVINSQQNTYNTIFNNSYNTRYNDRNVYTRGYPRENNVNTNLSRNILQQTLLRNLILRSASLANTENNRENNIPTEEQISNSTTRTTFQEIENPINTSCPISQSDFSNNDIVLQINHCGHIFSERPLLQWFNRNNCCPMCRYSIISDTSNQSIDDDTQLNNITRNNNGNISRNSSSSTINRNNSDPNITRNNSGSNSNFNRVPIITRINSSPNRFNSFNNFNSNVNNNTISNDMLNQLQTIIDTFNNEIEFEVALITPSQ